MKTLHRHESPERLFNECDIPKCISLRLNMTSCRGDTNKDEYLDAEELKEFYKHHYHAHAISEHFGGDDKASVGLDLDKDGN